MLLAMLMLVMVTLVMMVVFTTMQLKVGKLPFGDLPIFSHSTPELLCSWVTNHCWKFVIVPSASSCTYAVYWTFPVEHKLTPSHSTGYEPRALLGSVVLRVPLPLSHPS